MRTLLSSLAIATAIAAASPQVAFAGVDSTPAALHEQGATRLRSDDTRTDRARYAQNEQQHPKAADFDGGAAVLVIAGSGTVLVALLLLVLLL